MIEITIHTDNTTCLVKIPHCHTKSALLKNFIAAPNSKKPIITFTEFNQPPDWGSFARYWGNNANKKNGDANAVEKNIIPITKPEMHLTLEAPGGLIKVIAQCLCNSQR